MSADFDSGHQFEQFHIEKKLGSGYLGTSYLARDLALKTKVVLKIINPVNFQVKSDIQKQGEILEGYLNQAKKTIDLNHANIAKILDVKSVSEIHYISMEYNDCSSLTEYANTTQDLTFEQIIDICHNLVNGLQYAWDFHEIIHRFLSPKSLAITESNALKILDFGLVNRYNGITSKFLKTMLQYLAPEIKNFKSKPNPSIDIFSLGVIMYELCTNQQPFPGENIKEIISKKTTKDYQPLREINKEIPMGLINLIDRMLEPLPDSRIGTYDEVSKGLKLIGKENKSRTINCENCHSEISVGYDMIGFEVECPRCNYIFVIPNFLTVAALSIKADKLQQSHFETSVVAGSQTDLLLHKLSITDKDLLEDAGLDLAQLGEVRISQSWEFRIAAELLKIALSDISDTTETIKEIYYDADSNQSKDQYRTFIRENCCLFFKLQLALYGLMIFEMEKELVKKNVPKILNWYKKAKLVIAKLKGFHDKIINEDLPEENICTDLKRVGATLILKGPGINPAKFKEIRENQYIELKKVLIEWMPGCCVNINRIITYLDSNSQLQRAEKKEPIHISFIPPKFHRFCEVSERLGIGFIHEEKD